MQAQIEKLQEHNVQLATELANFKAELATVQAKLAKAKKNSQNSSKQPSSDIAKPPKKKDKVASGKRKQGGQPGHAKQEREPFGES